MSGSVRRLIDDCFLHDKDRLRHDDAVALLRERLRPVAGEEEVALAQAHGRVLAAPVMAPHDVPAFDNAAVDGYCFAHADLAAGGTTWFRVSARIAAGHPAGAMLEPGTAARIFTGAVLPAGADTTVMQEDARAQDRNGAPWVEIPAGVRRGINCRKAGEDVAAGGAVLDAGIRLRPQDLAAAASVGAASLICRTRLRVALISTGDEIVRPGMPLATGQVYDSNHYLLRALLETTDASVSDLGILADRADIVRTTLQDAAASHDVIMTTGGASRGEEDHIVATVSEFGRLHAWQLAIKPGRPLAFGQMGDTVFLGLPGNPVAVMVCFLLYARPMLAALQGADWREPRRFPVPAGFAIARKKPDRREFLRGWIEDDGKGGVRAMKFDRDGSGLISSLRAADGLIEIAEETTGVAVGDPVAFIPFTELGIGPR